MKLYQIDYHDIMFPAGGGLSQCLYYRKPDKRPEPVFDPPAQVEDIKPAVTDDVKMSQVLELIYNLSRSGLLLDDGTEQSVPPWSPYHCALSSFIGDELPVSTVAFNPILMAPPSDARTVYTTLRRTKEVFNTLGFTHVPIVFDMGLLTKALEITWSSADLDGVIPFEGGMHLLMSVISGIGFLYADAGLELLLHESNVFAAATSHHLLAGKDFDRGLYALKLVDEVLSKRFYLQFKLWCEENQKPMPTQMTAYMNEFADVLVAEDLDKLPNVFNKLNAVIDQELTPLLQQFRDAGRSTSPTFRLWDDYLQKVSLPLKQFICATRNGQWDVYLSAKTSFLPLLFATNRTNYARYLPVITLLMQRLPPEVIQSFKEGLFVAKLSSGNFNGVWIDYTLETTENKALKGQGGIIGLTMRGSALSRWFLSRPITAKYSLVFSEELLCALAKDKSKKKKKHHSSSKAAVKRWDDDVRKMETMFQNSYIDPFNMHASDKLVNFASGVVATEEVQASMIGALDRGMDIAEQFVRERLVVPNGDAKPSKSLYATLKKSNVKTMTDMKKKVKVKNKEVCMNGEVMYLRLLAINASKKVPMTRVMAYENTPVPISLFTDEGIMHGGTKSDFMHKLEELLPEHLQNLKDVEGCDAVIHDGNAVVHTMGEPARTDKTFQDMSSKFQAKILNITSEELNSSNCSQIHIVFDKYNMQSIKASTREKRGDTGGTTFLHHVAQDVALPKKWPSFLSCGQNKAGLARCYTDYVESHIGEHFVHGQCVYLSGGKGDHITKISNTVESIGNSDQEEADTRLILHAILAAEGGAKSIVINSPDTDVLMLLLHHRPRIHADRLYFYAGKRFIPVHIIYSILNEPQKNIMLEVYCLTGCDTTSFFYFQGKKKPFTMVEQKAAQYQDLATLGAEPTLSQNEEAAVTKFVGEMYGKQNCTSLNAVRAHKASRKVSSKRLPPTNDAFHLHMLRTLYQLMIWKHANISMQHMPDAQAFGYVMDKNQLLMPQMMGQSAVAPELINELICECEDDCDDNCQCQQHGQPCTAACECGGMNYDQSDRACINPLTLASIVEDEDNEL